MHPHIHYMTNIDLFEGAIVREVFLYINGQCLDLNKKKQMEWDGMCCRYCRVGDTHVMDMWMDGWELTLGHNDYDY